MTSTGSPTTAIPLPRERSRPYQPPAGYARLREEAPAARLRLADGSEGWLLTRYEDVRAMLTDPRFSSRGAAVASPVRPVNPEFLKRMQDHPSLLTMDPPEHTRMRRLLTGQFSVRRMRQLMPRIEQLVSEHLDRMIAAGPPAELVSAFALPIPSLVICDLLGVPYEDRDHFQSLSRTLLLVTADPDVTTEASDALTAYMFDLISRKRAEPGDDLLSALLHPLDAADELTDGEVISLGAVLLIAGHETTANMIGLSTYLLLQQPGAWTTLATGDTRLVESAVEELLRYLTIVQFGLNRQATEDVRLGGVLIRAGELVVGSLVAANHDPARFADPETLELGRGRTAHIAFGHGIHQCLGQQLARIELTVVFTELPSRLPTLELAIPADQVPMRHDMVVYGVDALPVTWTP
jgi:cytochrome P450